MVCAIGVSRRLERPNVLYAADHVGPVQVAFNIERFFANVTFEWLVFAVNSLQMQPKVAFITVIPTANLALKLSAVGVRSIEMGF